MLFIFILSSVPEKDIPDLSIPDFQRAVHFFEYSVLGGLWIRAFLLRRPGAARFKFSILAWALTSVFALSDEWHQTFVPGRSGEFGDLFFDMICAALGILLYFRSQSRRKQKNS
jgi:VanZ family protein